MPEVVEVHLTSLYLQMKLKNKYLTNINITGGRYKANTIPGLNNLSKNFPIKIKSVSSYGKLMYFNLDNKFFILSTFGLTGMWGFDKMTHSDVEFEIEDVGTLYYTDQMHYGTLSIIDDKSVLDKKIKKLSPDFLTTNFSCVDFFKRIQNYSKQSEYIVVTLMKQQGGLGSGIGNYLVAEILFNAKISPYTKISDFDKKLSDTLCMSIKKVIKIAYLKSDVGYFSHISDDVYNFIVKFRKKLEENPDSKYNYHKSIDIGKNKFKFNVYMQSKNNSDVKKSIIVKGRTTYWNPKVQNNLLI